VRIMCVLLPNFPLRCELADRPATGPAVVTYSVGSQKLVLDFSPELNDLERDTPVQEALAHHGEAAVLQGDLPRYWSIFHEILDALEQRSPLVEGADLGLAYIGIDGLQLIYPTDDLLIKAVREAVPPRFRARLGLAEGKFPAYLAALQSPPDGHLILKGNLRGFLNDLPCAVLPISLKSKSKLRDFGLRTLKQVGALPAGPLLSQFGPEGRTIRELALGRDDTPLYPRFLEENIEENCLLGSVTVSLEALLVTWQSLLVKSFKEFAHKGLGVRSLTLWTRTWNGLDWEQKVKFKEPAMNPESALGRIKPLVENFPQPGPVEQLGLRVTGLGHQCGRQKSLFDEVREREHLLEDIKQLELRLGSPQVFKIKEVEPWSRIPERRYALMPLSR
jgi:DNA polymerase IV